MANTYTLAISNILATEPPVETMIASLVATITGFSADPGTITTANFDAELLSGSTFSAIVGLTVGTTSYDAGTLTVPLTFPQNTTGGNTPISVTSTILLQFNDGDTPALYSNRSFVDFGTQYAAAGAVAVNYKMPAQVGTYNVQTETLNDTTWSLTSANTFTLGDAPKTIKSNIYMGKNYLVKFTGQVCPIYLDLQVDTNETFEAGKYQIVLDTKLQ